MSRDGRVMFHRLIVQPVLLVVLDCGGLCICALEVVGNLGFRGQIESSRESFATIGIHYGNVYSSVNSSAERGAPKQTKWNEKHRGVLGEVHALLSFSVVIESYFVGV